MLGNSLYSFVKSSNSTAAWAGLIPLPTFLPPKAPIDFAIYTPTHPPLQTPHTPQSQLTQSLQRLTKRTENTSNVLPFG